MKNQHISASAAASSGLLIGLLAGAVAALLLAPHDGRTTRRLILKKARHGRRRTREALEDAGETLARGQQRVTELATAGVEHLSRAGGRLMDVARETAQRSGT